MSNLLYHARVGSHAYGTATVDSDEDFVEVVVEEPNFITGLDRFDTEMSTNTGRTLAGGQDVTTYGLRKWASLVAAGNPNMIETLFIPNEAHQVGHDLLGQRWWLLAVGNRDAFLSKQAGYRFLGYAQSQQFALMGVKNKRTNRPELVHKHGYDTKFAGHLIRVLLEGLDLMRTGMLSFPLPEDAYIRSVRAGEVEKDDLLSLANDLRERLEVATEATHLPERADRDRINDLLHVTYTDTWRT